MSADFLQVLAPDNWLKKNGGPLYSQLSQHIENSILSGEFKEGDALPSERELASISNLSRVTVRKAVEKLVKDGLVIRRQGSGTSVAPTFGRVQQSLSKLTSFSEDMERRGLVARSEWLDKGIYVPSPEESMTLGISPTSSVARIARLRIANDQPLAIERVSISASVIADPNLIEGSLYEYLQKIGKKPVRAVQRISADILSGTDAGILNVEDGSAGLRIERIAYLENGQVVEFTKSVYRGDAYDFVAELQL